MAASLSRGEGNVAIDGNVVFSLVSFFSSLGDCGIPPDIPNSTADLENLTTFPVGFIVAYHCNAGFAKIIGKVNAAHCLQNGEWTNPTDFCKRKFFLSF